MIRNTALALDHIITNNVIRSIQHRSGIVKSDISDHFSIVLRLAHVKLKLEPELN